MRTIKYTFSILAITLLLTSCAKKGVVSSTAVDHSDKITYGDDQNSRNNTGSTVVVKDAVENATLDNYLQRVAGVNVSGTGASATITIRGISSFVSSNEPLFLINGQAVNGYSTAYNLCNANNIKSVSVLKDAATSLYGVRGSNGVIAITLKK